MGDADSKYESGGRVYKVNSLPSETWGQCKGTDSCSQFLLQPFLSIGGASFRVDYCDSKDEHQNYRQQLPEYEAIHDVLLSMLDGQLFTLR